MKKYKWIWVTIAVLLIVLGAILLLRGDEDTWIKDANGNWQKHGNPSAPMPD